MIPTYAVLIALAPLAAAMLALYTPYRRAAFAFLSVSIIAAVYVGVMTGIGVLAAAILVLLCYFTANTRDDRRKRALWLTGVGGVSFLMALHLIPGFNYTPIVLNVLLTPQVLK